MEEGIFNDHRTNYLNRSCHSDRDLAVGKHCCIVRQGEVKVVESFGKYVKTLEPGLHFLVPILYTVRERVSLKQIPLEIEPQSAITKDNVIVQIDEAIKYHVTDVRALFMIMKTRSFL